MIRRLLFSVALSLLVTACSGGTETSSPSTKVVSSPPTPAGSPQAVTPTAMLAIPAPTPSLVPSPVAAASPAAAVAAAAPSPAALASPAASPIAGASPAADASPVAIIMSPSTVVTPGGGPAGGPRYQIVPERSEALYRAREKFVSQPLPNEAIGRTNEVEGEIQLEAPDVLRGRVTIMRIDMRTFVSDQTRRDNFIRQNTLQTDQFPYAEFRSTEAAGPAVFRPGEEATFQIPGLMTVKGRERPVVWDARARLDGTTIIGAATLRVKLTDFGLEPPRLAILSVEDEMTLEIELVAELLP